MYATTIIDTSFPKAWERAVEFVRESPMNLTFGGGKEVKHALDSQTTIILDRHAILDVLNRKCHPSDPWSTEDKIGAYLKEYEKEFDSSIFDYTYRNRLEQGFLDFDGEPINQLEVMREGLAVQIEEELSSNRNIATTFNPTLDIKSGRAIPCWNEISVRWEKDGLVSMHDLYRSHDLFDAWGPNKIATTKFIYNEVIKPNNCEILYSTEHNISLHIYRYDLDYANNIKNLSRNPQLSSLQRKYDEISGNL